MELEVLKVTGESTGRKVQLNENIYGIEPNDHCIYLDVNLIREIGRASCRERVCHEV